MRHPDNKYFKISIWLSGGGKIIKEIDARSINDLSWINKQFIDFINAPSYSSQFLTIDNCMINLNDVSAIDIEEKIDPLNC